MTKYTSRILCALATVFLAATIAPPASAQTATNIAYAKRDLVAPFFFPDDTTTLYQVTGFITSPNFVTRQGSITNVEFYIQDTNDNVGIQVFFQDDDPSYASLGWEIGYEIRVFAGFIDQRNGVRLIGPEFEIFDLDLLNGTPTAIAPVTNTISALLASAEDFEGTFVKIENVDISGNWPGQNSSANLTMSNGTDSLALRIDGDTNIGGQPAPTGTVDVVGIFTQFDPQPVQTNGMVTNGYQVIARFYSDIDQGILTNVPPTLTVSPIGPISSAAGQEVAIDLFAADANAGDTLTFAAPGAPAGSAITQDPLFRTGQFTWTPSAAFKGSTNTITLTVTDATALATQLVDVIVLTDELANVIPNEIHYDPAGGIAGDANGDGIRDGQNAEDEFVEIYNANTTTNLDISDWVLRAIAPGGNTNIQFTFPSGTILTAETAVVVFGGGTPTGLFGGAQVFTPTNTWPNLANSGSRPVSLVTDTGIQVFNVDYSSFGEPNQSINLDPDITGSSYGLHSLVGLSGGALYSPGARVNGVPFDGSPVTNAPPIIDPIPDSFARIGEVTTITVTATDPEGNPIFLSVSNAPPTASFASTNGIGTLTYTGQVADAGTTSNILVTATDGSAASTANASLHIVSTNYSGLIVNEYLPNPAGVIDANNDGNFSTTDDEFIEIVNDTAADLDLAGVYIEDGFGLRHTFAPVTIPQGGAVVVFGGGSTAAFINSPPQTASTGALGLNNGGDTISLFDPSGNLIEQVSYGLFEAPSGASLNRDPDVTGATFSNHSLIPGSSGAASPGLRLDGTLWIPDQPPAFSPPPSDQGISVSNTLEFAVTAVDLDGDFVTLTTNGSLANATFTPTNGPGTATGLFSFTPDNTQTGIVVVSFVASDGVDGSTTSDVTITVSAVAPPGDCGLIISEYLEGSSFNKAIELYNGTASPISLAGYVIDRYPNGGTSVNGSTALSGSIAANGTYLIAHPSADPILTAAADQLSAGAPNFNGDDALVLRQGASGSGTVIDSFGRVGEDPGTEWGTPPNATANNTLIRKAAIEGGDTVINDAFDPAVEWYGVGNDVWTNIQMHTSATCSGGVPPTNQPPVFSPPLNDASVIAGNTLEITVIASEIDGDLVTLSASNIPANATFPTTSAVMSVTNVFSFTPDNTQTGMVAVIFSASDKDGTNESVVTITVYPPRTCGLIMSEYIEGTGNNKAIELYNGSASAIDLAAGNYVIDLYNNGTNTMAPTRFTSLTGTVASGGTYLIVNLTTNAPPVTNVLLNAADQLGEMFYNGDDTVVLRQGGSHVGAVVDSIGRIGEDPGAFWGTPPTATKEQTLIRMPAIKGGDVIIDDPYDPADEWIGLPQDTFTNINQHTSTDCPPAGPVDTDGDGIPDDWEITWCGGPTNCVATVDIDGDTFNYLEEYIADTIPTDSNSFFAITSFGVTGTLFGIQFDGSANRLYLIQKTPDIVVTNWVEVAPEFQPVASGTQTVFDDVFGVTNNVEHYRGNVRVP